MRLPELWENFCFGKLRIIFCLPAALPFSSVGTFRKTLCVFAPFTLPSGLSNVAKMQMSGSLLHLPRCDVCSFTTRHITHLQRSFNKKNGFLGVAIVFTRYKDMSYFVVYYHQWNRLPFINVITMQVNFLFGSSQKTGHSPNLPVFCHDNSPFSQRRTFSLVNFLDVQFRSVIKYHLR